jgi:eukaryotic-like serine/threonine-protein kinase
MASMDADREDRIYELQQALADLPEREWASFLDDACKSDTALQEEVLRRQRALHAESIGDGRQRFPAMSADNLSGVSSPLKSSASGEDQPGASTHDVPSFHGNARFSIQRQLGSGAFGTVYQVWDREQRTEVALKILRSHRPDLLYRFKREFRELVGIRHPNLVRFYELFIEDGQWFFTMELIHGEDFLSYVRPEGSCHHARLRSAMAQLALGIRHLHGAKRLHRDLKPANALVTTSGRLAIVDFGLVRELGRPGQLSRTQIAGTPAYMAPEQLLDGHVSESSDWYAAGVMLFEALTGALPRKRSSQDWGHNTPNRLSTDASPSSQDTPADLVNLCDRLLQLYPEDRPTVEEILLTLSGGSSTTQESRVPHINLSRPDQFAGRTELLRVL